MTKAKCEICGATEDLHRIDGRGILCGDCKKKVTARDLGKLERSNKEVRKDNGK